MKNVLQCTASFPGTGDLVIWYDLMELPSGSINDLKGFVETAIKDFPGRSVRLIQVLEEERMKDGHEAKLVGIHEVAVACGYTAQCVSNWRSRHSDFPKPVVELAMGPIFDERMVAKWLKRKFDVKYIPVKS